MEKEGRPKRPRIRRFNSKIFERPPVDVSKNNEFGLLPQAVSHSQKRQLADKLHSSGILWSFSNCLLSATAMLCAYIDNELCYYENISPLQSSAVRGLIIAISAVQICVVIQYGKVKMRRKVLRGLVHAKSKG